MKLRRKQPELKLIPRTVEVASAHEGEESTAYDYRKDFTDGEMAVLKQEFRNIQNRARDLYGVSMPGYQGCITQARTLQRNICILFPERRYEFDVADDFFDTLMTELREGAEQDADQKYSSDKAQLVEYYEAGNWMLYGRLCCKMSFLYPKRISEFRADQKACEGMEEVKREYKGRSNWGNYLTMVREMAVATADEVRVTEQGVELVNNERLDDVSDLPERNLAAK